MSVPYVCIASISKKKKTGTPPYVLVFVKGICMTVSAVVACRLVAELCIGSEEAWAVTSESSKGLLED